ncbi:MAG TPA: hypothetical protein VG714_10470 [Acidobacteriaceae bacterium]|nr:hypothetical protein [Acidobacteriaceae bacterium]
MTKTAFGSGPSAQDTAAYDRYIHSVEVRLSADHSSVPSFLIRSSGVDTQLRRGAILIAPVDQSVRPPLQKAMLHHWRATSFIPGATVAEMEDLLKDAADYPRYFAPQVLRAHVLHQDATDLQMEMRVRQHHVITVEMDSTYDVRFGRLDPLHGYSSSRSTQLQEIASPGTPAERPLSPAQEHGFLWRQNTYWSYEQRDGGLYIQVESISLTRSVPAGLGWAIGPYVESVPRDSLEFTLRAVCRALQTSHAQLTAASSPQPRNK